VVNVAGPGAERESGGGVKRGARGIGDTDGAGNELQENVSVRRIALLTAMV
jgi:hypothetical protein